MEIAFSVPGLKPLDEIGVFAYGGQFPAHVFMPTPVAAEAAEAALSKVGYDVSRPGAAEGRGRELTVRGWNAELLQARLPAMHAVLKTLSSDPGATAAAAIDRLGGLPATLLPDKEGQQEITHRAVRQLDAWIAGKFGVQARLDPRALPADPGCARLLQATQATQDMITAVVGRHLEITRDALAAYRELRKTASHDEARDTAVAQASSTPRPGSGPTPGTSRQQPGGTEPGFGPDEAPAARPRSAGPTHIFPAGTTSAAPPVPPPPASIRPPDRNSPGGPHP